MCTRARFCPGIKFVMPDEKIHMHFEKVPEQKPSFRLFGGPKTYPLSTLYTLACVVEDPRPWEVFAIVYGPPSLRWEFQQFFHALWNARSAWVHRRRAARAEVGPECISQSRRNPPAVPFRPS